MATSIWGSNGGVAATPAATNRIPTDISSSGPPNHHTLQQLADLGASIGVTTQALGSINTNTTITWSSGSYVTATITGSLTFTFDGAPSTGQGFQGVLVLTDGGSATITWPGSVTWTGGTAPTLRTSGVDVLRFYTSNGGTNWYGELAQDEQEFAASAITSGTLDAARLPSATTSASGAVELATVAECQAGTDTTRATTPEGVAAAIAAIGLAQPLTTVRATRQTSAPSAAASGEVKFQFRDIARYPLLDAVSDVSDPLLLFPSLADPLVSGWWVLNSTTTAFKGISTLNNIAATVSASTMGNNIPALNMVTSASANSYSGSYTSNVFREGSATGNGYLVWGITMTPDASYGSGATGVVINLGAMDQAGGTVNGNRPSARCAMLQYNTNQSDTNWQLLVHNGTTLTTVDTGCAFAAEGIWLWAIHVPRGGSATYAYVKNLVTGSSGSATASATSGSTALYFMPAWICTLTTTARNIRFVSAYLRAGGAS